MYHSSVQFFFPLRVLSEISLPSPVEMSDLQLARKVRRNLFSSAIIYPSMSASMKSSMMKELFCRCSCRLSVPSYIDNFLSHMNFHV